MGSCCCCTSPGRNSDNQPLYDSICEIKSKNGLNGVGFFCEIPFPKNDNKIKVLITSNKLVNEFDLSQGSYIEFNLKNSNKTIFLKYDKNRRFYTKDKHQVSIIEILEKDGLKNIKFFNVDYDQFIQQQELPNATNFFGQISLFHHNNDPNNLAKDQYYSAKINNFLDNTYIFTFTDSIVKNINTNVLGCPIFFSNKLDKVIGINITENNGNNHGILINKPIENFYIKYSKKIKVLFHDLDFNKNYTIEAFDFLMFGELIFYFYLQTNMLYDENITFIYNNNEIPFYSTKSLIYFNIGNNSKIFLQRRTNFMVIMNVTFSLLHGNINIIQALGNMTTKELILKYFLINRKPYRDSVKRYKFLYNGKQVIPNQEKIQNLSIVNGSRIQVIEVMTKNN